MTCTWCGHQHSGLPQDGPECIDWTEEERMTADAAKTRPNCDYCGYPMLETPTEFRPIYSKQIYRLHSGCVASMSAKLAGNQAEAEAMDPRNRQQPQFCGLCRITFHQGEGDLYAYKGNWVHVLCIQDLQQDLGRAKAAGGPQRP